MDGAMMCFGYYRSSIVPVVQTNRKYYKLHNWVAVQYKQRIQDFINDKKDVKFLYHISLSIYEEKILKQGLVPKSKNDRFNYPDRIYLLKDNNEENIKSLILLLNEAKIEEKHYNYNVYKIDLSKLTNTNFSIDYNYYPLAVFTADNIPPNALNIEYKITIN